MGAGCIPADGRPGAGPCPGAGSDRPATFTAHKNWAEGEPAGPVQFKLYRTILGDPAAPRELVDNVMLDGIADHDDPDIKGERLPWFYTWVDLPGGDGTLTYEYEVEEDPVPRDYLVDAATSASMYIPNTRQTVSHTVVKSWSGGEEPRPAVQFQLTQDGGDYLDPVTLEPGALSYTWHSLSRFSVWDAAVPENRRKFLYAVRELETEGYLTDYSADTWAVTNVFITPSPSPSPSPTPSPTITPVPTKSEPPTPSYPAIEVAIPARKVLQNGQLKEGQFGFELRDATGRVLSRVRNQADDRILFPNRIFSRVVNDYLYTVHKVDEGVAGMGYDTRVYTVSISTRAVDGRLEANVSVYSKDQPRVSEIVFTNLASPPATGDRTAYNILIILGLAARLGGTALLIRRRLRRAH